MKTQAGVEWKCLPFPTSPSQPSHTLGANEIRIGQVSQFPSSFSRWQQCDLWLWGESRPNSVVSADLPCEFSGWSEIQWGVNWNSRISSEKSNGAELSKESNQAKPSALLSAAGAHKERATSELHEEGAAARAGSRESLLSLELAHASALRSCLGDSEELVTLKKWGCDERLAEAWPGFSPPGKRVLALSKPLIPSKLKSRGTLRVWAKAWRSRSFSLKR